MVWDGNLVVWGGLGCFWVVWGVLGCFGVVWGVSTDPFVENQFQIALIINRSIDKKFKSRLLHSKAIKEGFHFATLKWHRLTCYLNWAILIGDPAG